MKNLVNALKAMSDEPRMSILVVLAIRGAVCVSHLQEALKAPQPTVSRYLSILRNAGLLDAERRGQWVYYKLSSDDDALVIEMISKFAEHLKDTTKIKRIMERLDKLEQQPSLPAEEENLSNRRLKLPKKPERLAQKKRARALVVTDVNNLLTPKEQSIVANKTISEGLSMLNSPAEPPISEEAIEVASEISISPVFEMKQNVIEELAASDSANEAEPKKVKRGKKQQLPSLFDL